MKMKKYLVIWLTGLPCSGKTTLAEIIVKKINGELLDGDDLRGSDFSKGIGFSPEARKQHLLRVGYLAGRLSKYAHVVCSFVSPSEDVRNILPVDLLIYVDCPVKVCAERDVKGMYAKARAGEIADFTGVDAPYEVPQKPDLVVKTHLFSINECVNQILKAIFGGTVFTAKNLD